MLDQIKLTEYNKKLTDVLKSLESAQADILSMAESDTLLASEVSFLLATAAQVIDRARILPGSSRRNNF